MVISMYSFFLLNFVDFCGLRAGLNARHIMSKSRVHSIGYVSENNTFFAAYDWIKKVCFEKVLAAVLNLVSVSGSEYSGLKKILEN